jgi:Icc-related predicted phosphoesterase
MKILAVSDIVVDWIYSPTMRLLLSDTELAIGCGDLPFDYLEFILSSLDIPLFYVHGNHSRLEPEGKLVGYKSLGSVCIHCKVIRYRDYTIAGVDGSLKYNTGNYQYTQTEMWLNVIKLVPSLLLNRINYGRFLNVFVSHAPPWGIHDGTDLPHQGIKAFRWLDAQFQPDYHLHGHIHVYRPDMITESEFGKTRVINTYGYQQIKL